MPRPTFKCLDCEAPRTVFPGRPGLRCWACHCKHMNASGRVIRQEYVAKLLKGDTYLEGTTRAERREAALILISRKNYTAQAAARWLGVSQRTVERYRHGS